MAAPTTDEQAPPEAANGAEPEPAPELAAAPANVVQALCRVMADLPGIGRDQQSEQGYNYRGIEAITRHTQALLAKYGVVFTPHVEHREVKDLTINSRPWTEDHLWVRYRVYGPGGPEDFIDVGPVVGLGRDNSDKGANKAMTQAFKYALIQTLCIGDGNDDPDQSKTHEADPVAGTADPDKAARQALRGRIAQLTPAGRDAVRAFCDERQIPRVPAKFTDEQMAEVEAEVDRLVQLAAGEPPAEQGPPPADWAGVEALSGLRDQYEQLAESQRAWLAHAMELIEVTWESAAEKPEHLAHLRTLLDGAAQQAATPPQEPEAPPNTGDDPDGSQRATEGATATTGKGRRTRS